METPDLAGLSLMEVRRVVPPTGRVVYAPRIDKELERVRTDVIEYLRDEVGWTWRKIGQQLQMDHSQARKQYVAAKIRDLNVGTY